MYRFFRAFRKKCKVTRSPNLVSIAYWLIADTKRRTPVGVRLKKVSDGFKGKKVGK
jgi:hypothetical protein